MKSRCRTVLSISILILATACMAPTNFETSLNQDGRFTNPVIWDEDTREDITADDPELNLAQATAVLFRQYHVRANKDDSLSKTENPLRLKYPVCEDEKFRDQNLLGHCSGVLVAPRILLTAGHCMKEQKDCDNIFISFGYDQQQSQKSSFLRQDLYTCKKILKSVNTFSKDFALIELDREVTQATPVKIGQSKTLSATDSVVSLSYPLGLPLKKDRGEILKNIPFDNFLRVKVDTFVGSSGSPLFNAQNELVGILSTGSDDFNTDEDQAQRSPIMVMCLKSARCTEDQCFGERYMKIEAMGF